MTELRDVRRTLERPGQLALARHCVRTSRMAAVAGEFHGLARIVTIGTAILVALGGRAVAGRMCALLILSHDLYILRRSIDDGRSKIVH